MNWFRLKGCAKCGGDLVLDEGDWLCLQCGTYYYTGLYRRIDLTTQPKDNSPLPPAKKTGAVTYGLLNLSPGDGLGLSTMVSQGSRPINILALAPSVEGPETAHIGPSVAEG